MVLSIALVCGSVAIGARPAAADQHVVDDASLRAALSNPAIGTIQISVPEIVLSGDPVVISRDVLIEGTGGPRASDSTIRIVRANGSVAGQGFVISAGNVTLRNLAITGADTRNNGGAIAVDPGASLRLEAVYIHGNGAGEGGGLYNAGTATILDSTFARNSASGKGGAVANAGTMTVLNSTFTMNTAKQGAALSATANVSLSFVTIVENNSTNKTGAATHENGGTAFIKNSILANNRGGDGTFHDCSGSPDLNGVLLSSSQGCNPKGEGNLVVETIAFDPLADNGGPTDTIKLPTADHPAVELAVDCADISGTEVGVDQRGITRPQPTDGGCDSGAYELGDASIAATLSTSENPVSVGAVSAPLDEITLAIQQAASTGTSVQGTPLSAIPLSAITIADAPLSAIPLSAIPLSAIPLSAIPLSAIPLSAIPLSAIPLSAIDSVLLSDLTRTDGGSLEDFLVGSQYEGWPLLSLTFADLSLIGVTAGYVGSNPTVASISLGAISPSTIGNVVDCSVVACGSGTLGSAASAGALTGTGVLGDVIGLDDVGLQSTPLSAIPLSAIALGTLPLSAIPLSAIDGSTGLDAWCYYLGSLCSNPAFDVTSPSTTLISVAVEGVPLSAIPLSAIPLSAIPLSAIPLSAIPLSAITWASTPLSAIPLSAIELSGVPLSAICADPVTCAGLTLGELGADDWAASASVGLLDAVVDDYDYVLWDLLFGLFGPQDIPWALAGDLNAIRLPAADNDPALTFDYIVDFTLSESNAQVTVELTLPIGFVPFDGSGTLSDSVGNPVATLEATETQALAEGNVPISLLFDAGELSPGDYTLRVPSWAGVELGEFEASVEVAATAASTALASDTTTVTVVEVSERDRFLTSGNLEIAHVSTVGDAEVFQLQVPGGIEGASVRLLLSNLGADLDLVLLGPPASGYLRGTPLSGFGSIEDHRYDLNPDDDVLDADVLRDVNVDAAKLGLPTNLVPIAVSANRDLANEEIEARIPTDGPYYAVVTGYNGASSNSAFALQGRFLGNAVSCTPLSGTWRATWSPGSASLPAAPDGLNTVILYNSGRVDTALASYLAGFSDSPGKLGSGVVAMAIPVDKYASVASALSHWYQQGQCDPEAANDVVRAIGTSILDSYQDVENVVIVGDDSHVPFARLVDRVNVSNEAEFGATLPAGASPELQSALGGGYYFSDDPYGSKPGIQFADGEFFVPSIAVGRLLETSDQILAQFQSFAATDGVLAGTEAAVTGYDFLTDGSRSVEEGLKGLDPSVDSSLIREDWTAAQLGTLLETELTVASINAHFDQYRLLPALGNSTRNESDLFQVSDLAGVVASASNIFNEGGLLFSMGCHSGLSVSNVQLPADAPKWARDWAEEITGLGAVWVANSGYGYGDSQVVAYSESISANFARYVDSMSAGQAWVRAKQRFASGLLSVSPYHTKAMNEFIFYGLPMVKTSTAAAATPPAFPEAGTGPNLGSDTTGVGLPVAGVAASTGLTLEDGYYSGNGGTLEVRGRAITALGELDVTRPDGNGGLTDEAVGVVITGLSSEEQLNFPPLFFNPISGYSATEDRPFVLDSTFPAGLARLVTYVDEDGQTRQKIVFAATRFRPSSADGSRGTLIKYPGFEADVYYRSGAALDDTPPLIQLVDGVSDGEIAYFQVEVDGDDHAGLAPADDTRRVNVLFAPSSGGSLDWQAVELVRVPNSNRWVGGAQIKDSFTAPFSFWVQACDAFGNCGASTAKGIDFLTAEAGAGVELVASGTRGANGWYRSAVSVAASSDSDLVEYRLDGGPAVPLDGDSPTATISIPSDGVHYLVVYDADGDVGGLLVAIDTAAPEVSVTVDPENGYVGAEGATVTIEATDGLSGVASIAYTLGGVAYSIQGSVATIENVTASLAVTITDRAGNVAEALVTIQFDGTPPTASATGTVADSTWTNQNVTVTITATDAESGLARIDYQTTNGGPTGSSTASPASLTVTAEGKSVVTYSATDSVGNRSTDKTFNVWIDRTAPIVTVTGPTPASFPLGASRTASFSCTDAAAGVRSCSANVKSSSGVTLATAGGVGVSSGTITLPTSTIGSFTLTVTAVDNAGNSGSATYGYAVGYRICLLYDPLKDQPATGAVAIKLQICDANGVNLSKASTIVTATSLVEVNPATGVVIRVVTLMPQDSGQSNSSPTYQFRYDAKLKGYIYNLNQNPPLVPGSYVLRFQVQGTGSYQYDAPFILK